MPSVDGVGRAFPLVAFASAPEGATFPPPEAEPQDGWFDALEDFLLHTLEMRDFPAVTAQLAELPEPAHQPRPALPEGMTAHAHGMAALAGSKAAATAQAAAATEDYLSAIYGSVWWTIGGEGYPSSALRGRALPSPACFTGLLTGDLFRSEASTPS